MILQAISFFGGIDFGAESEFRTKDTFGKYLIFDKEL